MKTWGSKVGVVIVMVAIWGLSSSLTYGSTDAVSCSKQDNALQNICKTVDNNKGIETQFPSAWSRLKYYGGCK